MNTRHDPLETVIEDTIWGRFIKPGLYLIMGGFSLLVATNYQDIYTGTFLGLAAFLFACLIFVGVDCDETSAEVNSTRFMRMGTFFLKASFFTSLITLWV